MKFDAPDDEAYGRVTDPEKYRSVVEAAREIVDELVRDFAVAISKGTAAKDFPNWHDPAATTVRLDPEAGAVLRVLFTDFPGVVIRFGHWGRTAFPTCGCDACDERPDELIDEFRQVVSAITSGGYYEELRGRTLSTRLTGPWGRRGTEHRLRRAERADYKSEGSHAWPEWPRC